MTGFCFFLRTRNLGKQCLDLLKGAERPERALRKRGANGIPNSPPGTSSLEARRCSTPFRSSGKGGQLGPGLGLGLPARTQAGRLWEPAEATGPAEAGRPRPRPRRAREAEPRPWPPRPAGGRRGPASIVRGRGEDAVKGSVARCA